MKMPNDGSPVIMTKTLDDGTVMYRVQISVVSISSRAQIGRPGGRAIPISLVGGWHREPQAAMDDVKAAVRRWGWDIELGL
jgi:hypothetical protein